MQINKIKNLLALDCRQGCLLCVIYSCSMQFRCLATTYTLLSMLIAINFSLVLWPKQVSTRYLTCVAAVQSTLQCQYQVSSPDFAPFVWCDTLKTLSLASTSVRVSLASGGLKHSCGTPQAFAVPAQALYKYSRRVGNKHLPSCCLILCGNTALYKYTEVPVKCCIISCQKW